MEAAIWFPLPPINGGGVRSHMVVDGYDVVVEKRGGNYYYRAFRVNGNLVVDSSVDQPLGWKSPREAMRAAESWVGTDK